MKQFLNLLILILLVGSLSFLQSWADFLVFGVKPNLALVAVIGAAFFSTNVWESFLLVAVAAFILKSGPDLKEILMFSIIGAGAIIIKRYLSWYPILSNLVLVSLGTLIFYVTLARDLIMTPLFLEELVLNLVGGLVFFALLKFLWQNKSV